MFARLGLGLYSAVASLVLAPLLPAFALHPRLRGGLWQRFGGRPKLAPAEGSVWLHGSSAGDVVALQPLAERLASSGLPVAISTWTRSGEALARRRLDPATAVFRQPFDLAGPVRAVLGRVRPRLLVLECLELWPRLLTACAERRIKVAVVNGRLSERSLRRYGRLPWLFRPCFENLSLVVALDEDHARRFVAAGVPERRVAICGSSKHAALQPPSPSARAARPRLVLGSLHPREEQLLLPWLPRLIEAVPGLEVVVAPRHPHRARRLLRRLRRDRLPAALLSRVDAAVATKSARAARVWVVDSMGRLAQLYRSARVAFVGGSLVDRGGHNVVEAAAGGAFVVTGPSLEHCAGEARALREVGAAAVIDGGEAFFEVARRRLLDADLARRLPAVASPVLRELATSADRVTSRLLELVR